MKTHKTKKNKVNIITLGCSKNRVDSEVLMRQLESNNISTLSEAADNEANVVIINTCGFIENAKQESIDTILHFAKLKENGNIEKVFVTGCLSQRYREDLKKEIPQVDAWFGTMELPLLLNQFKVNYKSELLGERKLTTANHFAYLKISEGCDRPCSFCAIPLMRGKHISKPIENILNEAKYLVRNGVKELLIIAQDTTYYGLDLYNKRMLAPLLKQLAEIEGVEWIRLHYAFPTGFPEDVLEVMAKYDNICKYIDIPLQHGASTILQSMKRGTTREKTELLLNKIREKVPNIAIRTTLIVGYPNETEEDFNELMDFIEKNRFDRLGVFTYSHEENTTAFSLDDNVSEKMKNKRMEKVMELQETISFELNQQKVGKVFKTLIDKYENGYFVGRTEHDSPEVDNEVFIKADENYLRIGDFCNIKIKEAGSFELYGELVK